MTTASPLHVPRGRRSTRPSGDDREAAILATAERLLDERPFGDISVDDLAKGAGLSRPTFYFYFPSKDAVLLTLIERVVVEADTESEGLVDTLPDDRYEAWRTAINVFFEAFVKHKGVTRAGHAARATNPEIRQLLATFMQKWIDNTAATIEAERARGAAPTTLPAQDLATALNLMNERALFASFSDEKPAIPREQVLDTLVHVWITSIYGQPR
ncbi:MAG TPA: TetR/AcrR family transcriptional regulator [Mycobacterium sp.]|nr:TetR/AcrR family transcriptional regulator [Mycobacterium sp.]